MKWIAVAIVIAALIAAATFIYMDRTRIECEERTSQGTVFTEPGEKYEVCRDGTGKVVFP